MERLETMEKSKEKPKIPIKDGANKEKYDPVNRALKVLSSQ